MVAYAEMAMGHNNVVLSLLLVLNQIVKKKDRTSKTSKIVHGLSLQLKYIFIRLLNDIPQIDDQPGMFFYPFSIEY